MNITFQLVLFIRTPVTVELVLPLFIGIQKKRKIMEAETWNISKILCLLTGEAGVLWFTDRRVSAIAGTGHLTKHL